MALASLLTLKLEQINPCGCVFFFFFLMFKAVFKEVGFAPFCFNCCCVVFSLLGEVYGKDKLFTF